MMLVTGATGFVGRAVVAMAARRGREVRGAARHALETKIAGTESIIIPGLGADTDWNRALEGVDVIVHTAARVHVMRDKATNPLAAFRGVNVEGTLKLARDAAARGVRRFVFVSTVKVNGERTREGHPFRPDEAPAPEGPYAVSKLEAEQGLQRIAKECALEVVVVRPPLVYGPGVRANFLGLIRAVDRGIPLPLAAVTSRRSLIGLTNLVDFLLVVATDPRAANETFLVSDGEDLTIGELVQRLGGALGRRARLVPVPPWILRSAAMLAGKRDIARRLLDSLQVDSTKAAEFVDWAPPLSIDDELKQTVAAWRAQSS